MKFSVRKAFYHFLFRIFPFLMIYFIIFYLSSKTVSELPSNIPDIIPHFTEYFFLSFLYMRIPRSKSNKVIAFALFFLILLSLLDEYHQLFVPTRFFSLKDLLIDLTGIITGIYFYFKTEFKILL